MKLNPKELGHISINWQSTCEGCLIWKQKSDSRRKGNYVCSEHWCRLKGNLLVLCRSNDRRCTDVVGIVFLERFIVTKATEVSPHAIRIEFAAGDTSLILIASSGTEANLWYHHLSDAHLHPTLERIGLIREELYHLNGCDPLEPGKSSAPELESNFTMEFFASGSPYWQSIELHLSCEHLSNDLSKINKDPNVQILVSVKVAATDQWVPVDATEVVEQCRSPCFSKMICLRSDVLTDESLIRFELSDVCDIKSGMGLKFGMAVASVEQLLACESTHLPILDPDMQESAGSQFSDLVPKLIILAIEHGASASNDEENVNEPNPLRLICDNILSKSYTFRHTLGERMHVIEYMGDSILCFDFPVEYLKSLIPREHLLYDSLSRIGSSDPQLEGLRKEMLITMRQSLEQYEATLRYLVDCSGTRFKPSWERSNSRYDFVPTNLQLHEVALADVHGKPITSHIITTVGAFSTSSRSYKAGGLLRQACTVRHNPQQHYPPSQFDAVQLSRDSPIAGAATLCEASIVGRAKSLLYKGTGTVNLLRTHLSALTQCLSARDQAEPLAERLQSTFLTMETLLDDQLLGRIKLATSMRSHFNELINLLTQLSVFDKSHNAVSSRLRSNYPTPNQPHERLQDRGTLMHSIDKTSSALSTSLEQTWDSAAELLWSHVLEGLTSLIRSHSSNTSIAASAASMAGSGSTLVNGGLPPSVLLAEAERVTVGTVSVDNPFTALAVLFDSFAYRHNACVCQALTSLLTALLASMTHWDEPRWKQVAVCGLLAQFEGLLSCHGNEQGMIEDWAWAVEHLAEIRIIVRPISLPAVVGDATSQASRSNGSTPIARMIGIRECELRIPWVMWSSAPNQIQTRGRVRLRIHPIYFNVGINEQQSVAEKFDKTGVQQVVNIRGLSALECYFERYTKHYGAPPHSVSNQDVCDLITNIRHLVNLRTRSKPVEILEYISEISQALGGLRFTSCKSAKDRTAMSVTLEQIRWLKNSEGMDENEFNSALQCIRRTGLRLDNVYKNTGGRKYAFNRLQLLSFPKIYRPPVGTYATGVTS